MFTFTPTQNDITRGFGPNDTIAKSITGEALTIRDLVFVDASGNLVNDPNSGANQFYGVAANDASNGAEAVCWRHGTHRLAGSGFAQADVGKKVYCSSTNTITKTSTSNSYVGRIVAFESATAVIVEIDPLT